MYFVAITHLGGAQSVIDFGTRKCFEGHSLVRNAFSGLFKIEAGISEARAKEIRALSDNIASNPNGEILDDSFEGLRL